MNLKDIKALEKKAYNEAKQAVAEIYKKHNAELCELIAQELPQGITLNDIDGVLEIGYNNCALPEKELNKVLNFESMKAFNYLQTIILLNHFEGFFALRSKIKGRKK